MSDLTLVIEAFLLFAVPVRILNLGDKVEFPYIVDGSAMLLRHRRSVYCAVVLSV